MFKRFYASLLAIVVMLSTINGNIININAAMIGSETIENSVELDDVNFLPEDVLAIEEANDKDNTLEIEESANDADIVKIPLWNRLYLFALDFKKPVENTDEINVYISADEEKTTSVSFVANKKDSELKLVVCKDSEECEIFYGLVDNTKFVLYHKCFISELSNCIVFEANENISSSDYKALSSDANELMNEAIVLWAEMLEQSDLSWVYLGFDKLDEFCKEEKQQTFELDEIADEVEIITEDIEDLDEIAEEATDVFVELGSDENIEELSDELIDETINEELVEETEEIDTAETEIVEDVLNTIALSPGVERIAVNYDSIDMNVGETVQLQISVFPENAKDSIYISADIKEPVDNSAISIDTLKRTITANYANTSNIAVKVSAGGSSVIIPVNIANNNLKYEQDEDGNDTVQVNSFGEKIVIADGIWVGGFDKTGYKYTGNKVTQDKLVVYYKGTELTLNKDYSLTYKNNINACDEYQTNSPSVTITMKGQYTGKKTLFYAIKKANVDDFTIETDKIAFNYNGKEQRYVPIITYNGKKLTNKKDFTIEYNTSANLKGDANSKTEIEYSVHGKGNFADGTIKGSYYIVPSNKNVSKATIKLNTTVKYTGTDINKNDLNLQIKFPGEKEFSSLDSGIYDVKLIVPNGNIRTGTGKVIITALDGGQVCGSVSKTFKIVSELNLATVAEVNSNFKQEYEFYNYPLKDYALNRQKGTDDEHLLSLKGTTTNLEEGVDYTVEYKNYKKVGTATAIFKGINKYSGKITKTYKLTNNNPALTVRPFDVNVEYAQGGAKPNISIYQTITDPWGGTLDLVLTENVDYTLKYINNNAVGTATVKITFKGNYAKAAPREISYKVKSTDISKCTVTVPDKVYSTKKDAYKAVPTIVAPNGKKLVAGKDYDKVFEYSSADVDLDIDNAPTAGTVVMVKINGINNYAGSSVIGTYRVYDNKNYNLNKLFVAIDDMEYTGSAIEPKLGKEIHLYATALDMKEDNELPIPTDYVRIISYKNNIKAGKGTVVLGGAYNGACQYGGTKSVTFKINKRSNNNVAVASVKFENDKETLTSTTSKATKVLTAIFNQGASTPNNQNLIWKSSNTTVVSIINPDNHGKECKIQAEGPGTAVISCTTQDGSKVAKCTITSVMKQATGIYMSKTSLSLNVGDSSSLTIGYLPEDAYVPGGGEASYSSSNTSVVTVDSNNGNILAVGQGLAMITGSIDGNSCTCFVEVKNAEALSFVNVKDCGATPDDDLDDTTAINNAIKQALAITPDGQLACVKIPAGIYNVTTDEGYYGDAAIKLYGAKYLYIYMEPGTVIRNIVDKQTNMRGIITVDNGASNVTIEGGTIEGLTQSDNENYHGIMVCRSRDIQIKNVNIKNFSADGIYLGKGYESNANNNIRIANCTIEGCTRNNIAVVNAKNVFIENCNINDAKGYYLPGVSYKVGGTGIDLEPNSGQIAQKVNISNCIFSNNRSDFGIHCHYHALCDNTKDITIDGCSFDKLVYIQCGKNVVFKNTVNGPETYYDDRNNGWITKFPD